MRGVRWTSSLVTLATVSAFFALGLRGWEGAPSACRLQACWCEPISAGWVAEPLNTWSNIPVLFAGMWIAWLSSRALLPTWARGMNRTILTGFSYALLVQGAGALFFHAALTSWSQVFDASSVLCVWSVILVSCLIRLHLLAPRHLVVGIVVGNLIAFSLRIFVTSHIEGPGLTSLLSTLTMEVVLARRRPQNSGPPRFLIAALLSLFSSFVFWGGALPGGFLCDIEVGHALWHLTAGLAVTLYGLHAAWDANQQIGARAGTRSE